MKKGPAAATHEDEVERAALVPPLPPCQNDDGAALRCKHDSTGSMAVDQTEQGQSSTAKPWRTKALPTRSIVGLVMGVLVVLALLHGTTSSGWVHLSSSSFLLGLSGAAGRGRNGRPPHHAPPSGGLVRVPIPFTCGNETSSAFPACPRAAAVSPSPSPTAPPSSDQRPAPSATCPEYFRYIHSDLSPWRESGITREAVESVRDKATFRLVVVSGRAYVEKLHRAYQTRDVFTLWGILQLMARYPGRVPDLDLMFFCGDIPEVRAAAYPDQSKAPPLFMYCTEDAALDIAFPDWTFWGWPEVNIRPWAPFLEEVARESRRTPWLDREPYAFWKGNPNVCGLRRDLMRCNASDSGKDWNARLFRQDWGYANRNGFKDSNLAKQCNYRYKIYAQGRGWSVSQKYILACGSPMLRVDTPFRDFFSRGFVAGKHYWPIDAARMCPSIKFAVDWGNAHPEQSQRMGEEGSNFARDELSMDYVYDYMLHLLTHYARLLRYRPTVPMNATELCLESMACSARGRAREFMMESMEKHIADYEPCELPQPFTADEVTQLAQRDAEVSRKVKRMEEEKES
ncbi:hypothetical protein SEVIR_3G293800v4 [Setaria viridis]|uniref:Glycosyl transferase CAP10 domain-containing protein n=1 Tax=Setaria viridis TaxID=4556 RepID=A0A4V6D9Z3_SETVI|nr:O-glucosyltransferase rumi-like [Setaria viridis]TKW27986.1 hypothetical protein SEVIR_3G293800v2 [Setaria viridis]